LPAPRPEHNAHPLRLITYVLNVFTVKSKGFVVNLTIFHMPLDEGEFIIMDVITGYISTHPAVVVIGAILIILLFLHVIFKNLLKLIFITALLLIVAFGYYYVQHPAETKAKVEESFHMVESGLNDIKDKSKSFYKDGKDLYKKTKEAPGGVSKLLDASEKEVEKEVGKETKK